MKIISKEELKKEYRELRDQNYSDEDIVDYFMVKLESDYLISKSNGIYVYMGTYKLVHESSDAWYPVWEVLVNENDPSAEYKVFKELDTGLKQCVSVGEDMERFENNNVIITIPNYRSFEEDFTFEEDFKKLRELYLHELCASDEETAISVVTSGQRIKALFSFENYLKENNISPVFYQTFFEAALCTKKQHAVVSDKSQKRM